MTSVATDGIDCYQPDVSLGAGGDGIVTEALQTTF